MGRICSAYAASVSFRGIRCGTKSRWCTNFGDLCSCVRGTITNGPEQAPIKIGLSAANVCAALRFCMFTSHIMAYVVAKFGVGPSTFVFSRSVQRLRQLHCL